MKLMLVAAVIIPCLMALIAHAPDSPTPTVSETTDNPLFSDTVPEHSSEFSYMLPPGETAQDLTKITGTIAPVSQETMLLRNIAQATFCLPQNILGTVFYGLLQFIGNVVETAKMNEVTIIVTNAPLGASLGKYIIIHTSLQTENAIRHEYGHTLQGYMRGPFFLLFEGVVSFVQAAYSMFSPSFAERYFDRWPEDEANELGGIH